MSDRRLLLVRHGVTDWNREGRFQGHLDPPLSDTGRGEARLLADRIRADDELRPARVIASSLARAVQTAEPIAEDAGIDVESEPRLIEIGQGEWEGRTHAELETEDAERYRAWRGSVGIRRPPGGESIEAATERVRMVMADLAVNDRWPVCLVSHGGTLRVLAHELLDLGSGPWRALDVDNASLGVLVMNGSSWRLERWNDTLHLLGIERTHVDESDGRPLAL